ncbi:MAG: pyridoxine 5'-phosphate synthase [Bacteroides sp.]|nr:pyridoxine 5'-phosphate synthase [Bacteroides sp.]
MTKLSVNINKVATIRNARGGNIPNLLTFAMDCEKFGADGITVHPRPDERHIRREDVFEIRPKLTTELNIEGYPTKEFLDLVIKVKPHQVTLVPDAPDQLTSNRGWNTLEHKDFLKEIIDRLKGEGIRTSIFVEANPEMVKNAADIGTDRVELYTEPYASMFDKNKEQAIEPFIKAAEAAKSVGLGLNAGHDLNLKNLNYFYQNVTPLIEVSIGHALISDALYLGLEKTIEEYKKCLK